MKGYPAAKMFMDLIQENALADDELDLATFLDLGALIVIPGAMEAYGELLSKSVAQKTRKRVSSSKQVIRQTSIDRILQLESNPQMDLFSIDKTNTLESK